MIPSELDGGNREGSVLGRIDGFDGPMCLCAVFSAFSGLILDEIIMAEITIS